MYLLAFKKGLNTEKTKVEIDRPLTFTEANEMFEEAVTKFKQTGQVIKLGYKILDQTTGEILFNSRISIDQEHPSLFQIIKQNKAVPKEISVFITKVEKREITEVVEEVTLSNRTEEKAELERLTTEKQDILKELKRQEKDRQQKEIEHEQKIQAIQDEKKRIEKSLSQKEKENQYKESERSEKVQQLEIDRQNAVKKMDEIRALDKKRKEEHEKRLKEVEDEAKQAELELKNIESELENSHLLRKKELQDLEVRKEEALRRSAVLQAENEKEEASYQQTLAKTERAEQHPLEGMQEVAASTTSVVPKATVKEQLQELDFETVKIRSAQFIKVSANVSVKGGKKAFKVLNEQRIKRAEKKKIKLEKMNTQAAIDEKVAAEKIRFMKDLQKEKEAHERQLAKEKKRQQEEQEKQKRIEERYRAAISKKGLRFSFNFKWLKPLFLLIFFMSVGVGSIYYFDLGESYPVLNEVTNRVDQLYLNIKQLIS